MQLSAFYFYIHNIRLDISSNILMLQLCY